MKYEVEFSTVVEIESNGDTDHIIKAAIIKLEKKLKHELRKGDIKKMFIAQISTK